MNRSSRTILAKQTVEIVECGSYNATVSGRVVDISASVRACLDGTRFFSPEELKRLRREVLGRPGHDFQTVFEVVNETTLAGIARVLARQRGPVAALNFASAKNPGGGFLNGSEAQEESLARSSGLYASLLRAREFYDRHRGLPSLLYSDAMILSPDCPVIRDDDGSLLEEPHLASFITSAAPNAGALENNQPEKLSLVPEALRQRAEYVLALAASQGYKQLVLGAWGCGVFRNDPGVVAEAFLGHLQKGTWSGRFECVVFSVLDRSPSQETWSAFQRAAGLNS
ncbi:MAG: TIGR02452 family protein [Gemmataceae bacterium]